MWPQISCYRASTTLSGAAELQVLASALYFLGKWQCQRLMAPGWGLNDAKQK